MCSHVAERKRILADLSPLREFPAYRRLWAGQTLSFMGTQMTNVALPVQIYRITHSTLDVGLLGLVIVVPLIATGLFGGSVADSMDRRRLVLTTTSVMSLASFALTVQAFADVHSLALLYVLAALIGAASAADSPARQTFIPRLLPLEKLPAGNALNGLSMTMSLTLGPLVAGVLIATVGLDSAYGFDTLSFFATIYAVLRLPAMLPTGGGTKAGLQSVLEGLRWLKTQPVVQMSFLVDIVAMVFGMPRALAPAFAEIFHGGGGTVGAIFAAPAIGAFLASALSGPLAHVSRQGLGCVAAIVVWGVTIAGFGVSPWLWLGLVFLAMAGAADMVSAVFRSTIMQTAAPDDLRGRLGGIFFVVVAGGPRLGDLESGVAADIGGVRFSAWSGGLLCLVFLAILTFAKPVFIRFRKESLVEAVPIEGVDELSERAAPQ
jgi:MFS family permease